MKAEQFELSSDLCQAISFHEFSCDDGGVSREVWEVLSYQGWGKGAVGNLVRGHWLLGLDGFIHSTLNLNKLVENFKHDLDLGWVILSVIYMMLINIFLSYQQIDNVFHLGLTTLTSPVSGLYCLHETSIFAKLNSNWAELVLLSLWNSPPSHPPSSKQLIIKIIAF